MIFENGFPRVQVADDMADSPVLNFWLCVLKDDRATDPVRYYTDKGPVRYPFGKSLLESNPRCFSRDQLIMLTASEYFYHGKSLWKPKWFAPNTMSDTGKWKLPDPMFLPHQMNHQKMCALQTPSDQGLAWLLKDIQYNAEHTPLREPNQLLAMCLVSTQVTGINYVKLYCELIPQWREAIKLYWNDDRPNPNPEKPIYYNRGEPELTKAIVKYIEGYL